MKFTISTLLAATVLAGKEKYGKDSEEDYRPLPPSSECLDWKTSHEETCDSQWNAWERYCRNHSTDMCERVDDVWYA